jgi:hypothetical protein
MAGKQDLAVKPIYIFHSFSKYNRFVLALLLLGFDRMKFEHASPSEFADPEKVQAL